MAFLEYLTQNGARSHSPNYHISVLQHFFKLYDIDHYPLSHKKVFLFMKSVSIDAPYLPRYKANITIPLLLKIVCAYDGFKLGCVYKAIFGDIIFGLPGAHIIVKLTKSICRLSINFKWSKSPPPPPPPPPSSAICQ